MSVPEPFASEEDWQSFFKVRAEATWGPERAAAMGETLARTARAVRHLQQLGFAATDVPGFFLDPPRPEAPRGR